MRRIWTDGLAVLSLLGLSSCSVPDYTITPSASGNAAIDPADASTDDAAPPDVITAKCTSDEACAAGSYCATDGACKPGCRSDAECVVPGGGTSGVRCDPVRHLCRGCEADAECPAGTVCAAGGVCAPGCTATHPCAEGKSCCGDACIDTTSDVAHCGGCGLACTPPAHGAAACVASTCAVGACDPGYADCDGAAANGCEAELATDVAHCGACGTACTYAHGSAVCVSGTCGLAACDSGFGNCDTDPANGCERDLSTLTDCGACGSACAPANATGACASGACTIAACAPGFADCDGLAANGCEVDLSKDATHCGACGNVCPSTSGTPSCVAGVCKYASCAAGLGDCDGSGSCATTLTTDVANCGTCGKACSVPNGTPTCSSSSCGIASCSAGFANCDGAIANGCETNLATDASSCGACGNVCSLSHAASTCSVGLCTVTACDPGYANCDSTSSNGCERNLAAAQNSCSTAPSLLDQGGNTSVCGNDRVETTQTVTTTGTKFYKMRLAWCDDCTTTDKMRLRATLVSPPGAAYDLRLYTSSSCSSPVATAASGTLGGTETLTWVDSSCSSRDVWFEVRWRAGSSCSAASMVVTGAYTPFP